MRGNAITIRIVGLCSHLNQSLLASSCRDQCVFHPTHKVFGLGLLYCDSDHDQPCKSLIQITNIAALGCVVQTHQQAQELIPIRRWSDLGSQTFFELAALPKTRTLKSNERTYKQQRELIASDGSTRTCHQHEFGLRFAYKKRITFRFCRNDSNARTFGIFPNLEPIIVVSVLRAADIGWQKLSNAQMNWVAAGFKMSRLMMARMALNRTKVQLCRNPPSLRPVHQPLPFVSS